jgi:hypothetical protein
VGVNTLYHHPTLRSPVFLLITALFTVVSAAQDPQKATLTQGLFSIEYPVDQRPLAEGTLAVLEEAVREFDPKLPAGDGPIHVVVADVSEEFDRYAVHFAGLNVSGLAQPGNDLIIVKAPRLRMPGSDYPGTLRHELVHLLLHRNVHSANLPQWLDEGIAISLANEFYWQGMFKVARMFIQNRIIPYPLLDDSFYAPTDQTQFNDAYAQALSMTRYLRDRLGETLFWNVVRQLRNTPFDVALSTVANLSLDEFWAGYSRALWKYAAVATMASGFFFQPAAILLIIAYIRRRRIARDIYRRWEAEAAAESAQAGTTTNWEELVEDPEAWKRGKYKEEEES